MALIKSVRGFDPIIGKDCFLADNATIIGDVVIGDECSIWFGTILRGDVNSIKVGNRVTVGAQSGIPGNTKSDIAIMGYPAIEHKQFARAAIVYKKLPDMYSELGKLQKEIEELKKLINK